jgi:hypothetical protein
MNQDPEDEAVAHGSSEVVRGMTDAQFTSALADLRAHPDEFVALATLPWVEAHEVANDLWNAGIEAAFVARDDPAAPIDPVAGLDETDDPDELEDDEPPPGLERVRGGSVQPWLRPNQPPVASVVLCVRSGDEDEARRVAGRRLGVL